MVIRKTFSLFSSERLKIFVTSGSGEINLEKNWFLLLLIFSLLYSVKNILWKENIKFSSKSFFPFPETAHDSQNSSLQSRWCLYYMYRV